MTPEDQDWIDHAIARDGLWDPPAHFVERVAVQAFQVIPADHLRHTPRAGVILRLRDFGAGVREELSLRIQGSLWVLRQYRELLLH